MLASLSRSLAKRAYLPSLASPAVFAPFSSSALNQGLKESIKKTISNTVKQGDAPSQAPKEKPRETKAPEIKFTETPKSEATSTTQSRKDTFINSQGHFVEFAPKICVIGVGGAGGNAVNNMIARQLSGIDYLVCNTDAQHLSTSLCEKRVQMGTSLTEGLGCGANPEMGLQAAEESIDEIMEKIGGSHMVFITAGMGGGTGTGAASVIAQHCLKKGILTVAVVTTPFRFEGMHRGRLAMEGVRLLEENTDTLIAIPNQNLFQLVDKKTSLVDAFSLADDVLLAGVKSVTDLMVNPGLINLDFADVRTIMQGMGYAMMGTGEADGENRAVDAAGDALKNPLLGDLSVKTAKGMLVNITGGDDLTLFEVDAAAQHIIDEVDNEEANIIFGSAFDPSMQGRIRVSVVATGIETGSASAGSVPLSNQRLPY